ncbi:hypothetical protein [uncultured Gammaproteobacteria bacterium]|jgi:hypothetical protein|nr:hypothetical protein [uncultured Gammaproteobacteria bacterium]CAC9557105.1 hypothetical protein [uncultured Gammaproteobacteria bacterium]CAC9567088.1 hypothetical protein [uncultured Gammaproteobacteria bacterium]CAC9583420.1 hypothetical protein [uncultured Gammaproteobacteria bacterium]CAC9617366.1 hypothetical protein [uncultured Gammaproteobacteria bacterium]
MGEIYFQLNSLAVLTGISLAIIQYLFTNHQNTLKDILFNLKKIEFKRDNSVDSSLEVAWERVIHDCKIRTYIVDPNKLIGAGFLIIFSVALLFNGVLFKLNIPYLSLNGSLKVVAGGFVLFLIVSAILMYQMFSKESSIKKKFRYIERQHNMVEKVLSNK